MRSMIAAVTLLTLVLCAAALAQPSAPPPGPPPELAQLWFLEAPASWHCTGTSYPPGGGAGHPVEADVPIRSDLDGHWRTARYEEKKTAQNPGPVTVQEFYTYDAAQKSFLYSAFDSMGGWLIAHAPTGGPDFAFTGEAHMGPTTTFGRISFARKAPAGMAVVLELGSPDGKWAKLVDLVCKK